MIGLAGVCVQAYHWYQVGHQRGHFASVWQRSLYNVKGLKAQPWWTPKETGYTELVKVRRLCQVVVGRGLELGVLLRPWRGTGRPSVTKLWLCWTRRVDCLCLRRRTCERKESGASTRSGNKVDFPGGPAPGPAPP